MAQHALKSLYPEQVNSYTPQGDYSYYTPENLYDYINGGAELFISYGFDTLLSRTYENENNPEVLVEIFSMNSPADAYGVYSIQREKENVNVGQGGQYIPGSLMFWKDHYFISIIAERETSGTKAILLNFGQEISNNIPHEGKLPGITGIVPKENLVEAGLKYFHHAVWQNTYYFIAHENIFMIDNDTPSLLARYGEAGNRYFLLLIQYNSAQKAKIAYSSAKESFFSGINNEGLLKMEDGKWALVDQVHNYLIAVFNADNKNKIEKLHDLVKNNILSP